MSLVPMVEEIVKNCVLEPDEVEVEETEDRGAMIYTVSVAQSDVGRIIGKEGRVISCIRQVVGAAGAKAKSKAIVKVRTDD